MDFASYFSTLDVHPNSVQYELLRARSHAMSYHYFAHVHVISFHFCVHLAEYRLVAMVAKHDSGQCVTLVYNNEAWRAAPHPWKCGSQACHIKQTTREATGRKHSNINATHAWCTWSANFASPSASSDRFMRPYRTARFICTVAVSGCRSPRIFSKIATARL